MHFKKIFVTLALGLACLIAGCGSDPDQFPDFSQLARIVFAVEPQTTVLGENMPAIRLEGRDQTDQVIAISQGTAELTLSNNPTGANLLENGAVVTQASVAVQNGVALFPNLRVDKVGVGYTLQARYQVPGTDQVLTTTSQSFDVTSSQVTSVIFMRSTQNLWDPEGGDADVAALDGAFGTGNWTLANFETAVGADVFQGNRLVYMDGGDSGAIEMQTFLTAQSDLMRTFVSGGGRVIVNSAPNEGGNIITPFNATIAYGGDQSRSTALVDALHPIGVACNGTLEFTGSSFSHALVVADDMTAIITGSGSGGGKVLNELDNVVLAEGRLGSGLFLVGGMTTTNFHNPVPNALQLRINILRYAGGLTLLPAGTPITKQDSNSGQIPSSHH